MRKFAVLLSGGVNAGSNYSRYLNDLREMYLTLIQKYGYAKQDIEVAQLVKTLDRPDFRRSHRSDWSESIDTSTGRVAALVPNSCPS